MADLEGWGNYTYHTVTIIMSIMNMNCEDIDVIMSHFIFMSHIIDVIYTRGRCYELDRHHVCY